jgi:hypothetical protein
MPFDLESLWSRHVDHPPPGSRYPDSLPRLATSHGRSDLDALPLVATVEAGPVDKTPPASTSGAKVLFDGKNLEGWKKCDFYKAGEVKVEDGMIIMSKGVSMSGVTSTRQDLPTANYELSYVLVSHF